MARRGLWLACLVLGVIALPILADRLALLPLRISLNPNEGWNALHTQAWLAGRPLYLNPAGPVLNNYPPLSFAVVALLGRLTGDLIVAGRILALVSLLAVATFSGVIACMVSGARAAGWFTGMLFCTTFLVGYTDYVAMNDPQLLALALSTLGLWALLRNWDSPAALIGAMVLMLLAGLAKHNMIALPIATLIAVWLESPRRGVAMAIGGGLATVTALGVIYFTWGGEAILSLVAGRQWKPLYVAQNIQRALPVLALPLAAVVAGAGCFRGAERSACCSSMPAWRLRPRCSPPVARGCTTTASSTSRSRLHPGRHHRRPGDAGARRAVPPGEIPPGGAHDRRGDACHHVPSSWPGGTSRVAMPRHWPHSPPPMWPASGRCRDR